MSIATDSADNRSNSRSGEVGGAVRYERFHTDDPRAATRFFAGAYAPGWRLGGLAGGASLTHRRFETDAVTIDELLIEGRVGFEIRPADTAVVIQPRAGSLSVANGPGSRVDTALLVTDDLPCVLQADTARLHVVSMDVRELSSVAGGLDGPLPQRVQFPDCRPRSSSVARAWNQALDYAIGAYGSQDTARQPLIVAATAQLLGAALLECFPSNVTADQALLGSSSVPATFKSAVSFIHAHTADGIGVNDVAAAVRLTPRAVQYLFRQHLDTTPTEYLRRARLHRAHQDLIASDRSTTTVAEIAQRWGFTHTGRFAAIYRDTYGRSPHIALQR